MGRLKEWALSRPCAICEREEAGSLDPVAVCSEECAEKRDVYEAIADEQEKLDKDVS